MTTAIKGIPANEQLTHRQLCVLAEICKIADQQRPVTLRELQRVMGLKSHNTMMGYLNALERKGMITREREIHGTIRPTHRIMIFKEAVE